MHANKFWSIEKRSINLFSLQISTQGIVTTYRIFHIIYMKQHNHTFGNGLEALKKIQLWTTSN